MRIDESSNPVRTWVRVSNRCLAATVAVAAVATVAGCGTGNTRALTPKATPAVRTALGGKLFGGQQPVTGSVIQLYAVGSAGYGSAATPLLPAGSVKTDATGSFNTVNYTCPTPDTPVYITASGGNSGFAPNAGIGMMAALGPCGSLSSATFVFINELTTVASVYALSPFMTGPANVGAPPTNAVGLNNAFADVNVLVNTSTGNAPGAAKAAGVTVPTAEINTLGNILAACINSSGGIAGDGSPCGTLFAATNTGAATAPAPSDTVSAALSIAQHPGKNMAALFALPSAAAPFQPSLAAQPNDFSLAIVMAGGTLNRPSSLAADAGGNVWVANAGGNTVTEYSHTGATMSGTGFTAGFDAPSSIAIDGSGSLWVTNQGNNSVSRMNSTGTPYPGAPYTGAGLNQPRAIAFDGSGNAWIANLGDGSVTEMDGSGTAMGHYTPGSASTSPVALAVNPH